MEAENQTEAIPVQKPNRTIILVSIAGAVIGLILLLSSSKKETPKVIKPKPKQKIKTKTKVIVVDTKGTEIHNDENEEIEEEENEEFELEDEENGK